jgi:hypothetical protein
MKLWWATHTLVLHTRRNEPNKFRQYEVCAVLSASAKAMKHHAQKAAATAGATAAVLLPRGTLPQLTHQQIYLLIIFRFDMLCELLNGRCASCVQAQDSHVCATTA